MWSRRHDIGCGVGLLGILLFAKGVAFIGDEHEPVLSTLLTQLGGVGVLCASVGILARASEAAAERREMRRLGDRRAIDLIARRLYFRSPEVRLTAIQALAEFGDPQAVPHLLHALRRFHGADAEAVMRALGRIGDPLAVPTIIGFLGKPWMPTPHRVAAIQALAQLRDARAVPALTHTLSNEVEAVSHAAARALGEIGAPAADALAALRHQQETRNGGPYHEASGRIIEALKGAAAELEAAPAPEGRGTEPEASAPPHGRGTEPEASAPPRRPRQGARL